MLFISEKNISISFIVIFTESVCSCVHIYNIFAGFKQNKITLLRFPPKMCGYFDKREVIKVNNVNLDFDSYYPIDCACLPSCHTLKLRVLE